MKKWYDNEAYLALAIMIALYVLVLLYSSVAKAELPRYMDEGSQVQTLRDMQDFWARDRGVPALTNAEMRILREEARRRHKADIIEQHQRTMELHKLRMQETAKQSQGRKIHE